jgi:hypothetical protein
MHGAGIPDGEGRDLSFGDRQRQPDIDIPVRDQ